MNTGSQNLQALKDANAAKPDISDDTDRYGIGAPQELHAIQQQFKSFEYLRSFVMRR